ncbi:MAG: ABC transporter permease [Candidatus Levybacteria bacterium]|nr:ABC transporter permease [Candidatus Levybacteria bacterium]
MRFLKTAWHHIKRSPYRAFAIVFILMQTFFVISLFTFLVAGSVKIIAYFESLPPVTAFFVNDAKQEDIDGLKEQLLATGKISEIRHVSKEEALKIYQEQNKDDPLLLEFVTADILPSSFEISAKQIEDLAEISSMIKGSAIVKEVVYQKEVVSKLQSWTDALRKIGIAMTTVLLFDSIFLMIILIGIKIAQKKDEIEIVKLLGATNWYVRWPFIFEGMFYGIVGAILGWLFSIALLWYSTPFLQSFLGAIPIFPISPLFIVSVLGAEILLAIVLGVFSSLLAVLRYLK